MTDRGWSWRKYTTASISPVWTLQLEASLSTPDCRYSQSQTLLNPLLTIIYLRHYIGSLKDFSWKSKKIAIVVTKICFFLFQRHFAVFAVHFPGADALATIFSSILSAHFLQGGFSFGVSRSVGTLIQVHTYSFIATFVYLFIWTCFSRRIFRLFLLLFSHLGSYLSSSKD